MPPAIELIFIVEKHNTLITINCVPQNGINIRPDILVSIYGRVLGSNLRFQILRKFWKGKKHVLGKHAVAGSHATG